MTFDIELQDGRRNDVVNIYIDGVLKKARHDLGGLLPLRPRSRPGTATRFPSAQQAALPRGLAPPTAATQGNGFLVDGVSLSVIGVDVLYADRLHRATTST